jgi:hypothetical protein
MLAAETRDGTAAGTARGGRSSAAESMGGTVTGARAGSPPLGSAALLVRQAWPWWLGWRPPGLGGTAGGGPPLRADALDARAAGTDVRLPPRGQAAGRVAVAAGTATLRGAGPRARSRRAARAPRSGAERGTRTAAPPPGGGRRSRCVRRGG